MGLKPKSRLDFSQIRDVKWRICNRIWEIEEVKGRSRSTVFIDLKWGYAESPKTLMCLNARVRVFNTGIERV